MMKWLIILISLVAVAPAGASCIRTVVIGDSQMAYGVTPFKFDHTLDPKELSRFSYDALGTYLFRYFAGENCGNSTFVYSQGGSGAKDWLGEGLQNGTAYPNVPFIGGSRMILQPGFSWMTDQVGNLTNSEKRFVELASVEKLVDAKNWIRPDRVIVGLSANDWGWSEEYLIDRYTRILTLARGGTARAPARGCYLISVAGVRGNRTQTMRRRGEPEIKTDENVARLMRVGRKVTQETGCNFIDLSSVHPSEPDGLHLGGVSAKEAYLEFKRQFELSKK